MDFSQINYWAVLVAALAPMGIGVLWYSPALFGKIWMRVNGFSGNEPRGNMARTMIIAFILSLVMSLNLAAFLAVPGTNIRWGITAGFLAGFGWVTLSIVVISLFERRPFAYMAVNGGYWVVSFIVMGAILGAWR